MLLVDFCNSNLLYVILIFHCGDHFISLVAVPVVISNVTYFEMVLDIVNNIVSHLMCLVSPFDKLLTFKPYLMILYISHYSF